MRYVIILMLLASCGKKKAEPIPAQTDQCWTVVENEVIEWPDGVYRVTNQNKCVYADGTTCLVYIDQENVANFYPECF